ncbi:MAG: hypothetical protein ACP5ON_05330 [Bacteroidota bacterium]
MYLREQNLVVDLRNDNEYLYLSLATNDRLTQQQIVRFGLTVWFDYQGNEAKRFGIHYPITDWFSGFGGRHQFPATVPNTSWRFPEHLPDDIEIFGPMKDEQPAKGGYMKMVETKGIDVKIKNRNGTMLYVVQIPLLITARTFTASGRSPAPPLALASKLEVTLAEAGEKASVGVTVVE